MKGAADGAGDFSVYTITMDPLGTSESLTIGQNSGNAFNLTMVTLGPS